MALPYRTSVNSKLLQATVLILEGIGITSGVHPLKLPCVAHNLRDCVKTKNMLSKY